MGWSKCLEYVCLIGMHIGWIFVLVRKLQREVFCMRLSLFGLEITCILCEASIFV